MSNCGRRFSFCVYPTLVPKETPERTSLSGEKSQRFNYLIKAIFLVALKLPAFNL